jgi:hypothetical protein
MFSVTFDDHREAIKEKLNRKLLAAVNAAAVTLSDGYQSGLQETIAPPHSRVGEVPHAYFGHRPGGFGPVNGYGEPNNTPLQGFERDQTEFLSESIRGGANGDFGSVEGFVGFAPSHVGGRFQNYLLWWDSHGRPWVDRLFRRNRAAMAQSAKSAFEAAD